MLAVFWERPEIEVFGEIQASRSAILQPVIAHLDLSLRSAGVAFSLVLMLVVALHGGWRRRADLLAVVGCAAAYLICSAPSRPCCSEPVALPLLLGAIGFPFAFWRLARVVLEDDARIPEIAWGGLGVLWISGVLAASEYLEVPNGWRVAFAGANKIAAFGFIGAALYTAWRSWDGDLVEPRRRLRWALVGYLGAYGLIILVGEVYLLGERPPAWLDTLNVAMIDASMLVTLAYLVHPRSEAMETLFAPAPEIVPEPQCEDPGEEPPSVVLADDAPLLERLQGLMEEQKLYRDPDLSVRAVSDRMAVPEYVLRRLIHERLGLRNFAAFVNDWRLREVKQRLEDPTLDRRPILTLALEAGFGSIGPFNRTFRERYGTTPTEFRALRAAPNGHVSPAR